MAQLWRPDTGARIIPDGVRFMAGQRVVFELEPGVRNVDIEWWKTTPQGSLAGQYLIAFPYMVFLCQLCESCEWENSSSVYTFFRNRPLRSLDDELYVPALPNCLGDKAQQMYYACGTYASTELDWLAYNLRTEFFAKQFNKDGYKASGHQHYLNSLSKWKRRFCKIRDPETWERHSIKDPRFILKMDWLKTKHTPRTWLAGAGKEPILNRMVKTIYANR